MQPLRHTSHILSASWVHVAGGCHAGECGCRPFPPLRKVLLGGDALDSISQSGGKQDASVCACKVLQRHRLGSQQEEAPRFSALSFVVITWRGTSQGVVPVPSAPSNLSF